MRQTNTNLASRQVLNTSWSFSCRIVFEIYHKNGKVETGVRCPDNDEIRSFHADMCRLGLCRQNPLRNCSSEPRWLCGSPFAAKLGTEKRRERKEKKYEELRNALSRRNRRPLRAALLSGYTNALILDKLSPLNKLYPNVTKLLRVLSSFYLRRRLASEGTVPLDVTLCVCPPSRLYHVSTARRIMAYFHYGCAALRFAAIVRDSL